MSGGKEFVDSCGTCRANRGKIVAPGGVIHDDGVWRLEHVLEPIPLVGWLVLKPWRHVESMANLTDDESLGFGLLSRRVMAAMRDVLHPEKIYLCLFAEAEGFAHIHFHFIPRFADTPLDRRGPNVFAYLAEAREPNRNMVDVSEASAVVEAIRQRLAS